MKNITCDFCGEIIEHHALTVTVEDGKKVLREFDICPSCAECLPAPVPKNVTMKYENTNTYSSGDLHTYKCSQCGAYEYIWEYDPKPKRCPKCNGRIEYWEEPKAEEQKSEEAEAE